MYDVINVFEGLGLITKIEPRKKNSYLWNGLNGLLENIEKVRRRASLGNQNQGTFSKIQKMYWGYGISM